jgi:filamentous hemagglutinin family protein
MNKPNSKHHTIAVRLGLVFIAGFAGNGWSEVTLDGSMGPKSTLPGPHYQILQQFGQTVGSNLFHSFGKFDLETGTAATFYGSPAIGNIFGRVTGGSASHIDGLVNSDIPGANLWLINPSGVLFGPHASVNVTGSFYVSTAHYLKFSDGLKLETTAATSPVLTAAPPEAFGFLAKPAGVTFQGTGSTAAQFLQGTTFSVPQGKDLSITSGEITLTSGNFNGTIPTSARLATNNGRIAMVAVESTGEINVNSPQVDHFETKGKIVIENGSTVETYGNSGQGLVIRGGEITIASGPTNVGPTGVITITDDIKGEGTPIQIKADNLTIQGSSQVSSLTIGAAKGGAIHVDVNNRLIITDPNGKGIGLRAGIYSSTQAGSSGVDHRGSSGSVSIKADAINLHDGALISGDPLGLGKGADISVNAKSLSLISDSAKSDSMALITSKSVATGAGAPGTIKITADSIQFSGARSGVTTSSGSDLDAGDISINAGDFKMSEQSRIVGDTFGNGRGSNISLTLSSLELTTGAQISSSTGVVLPNRLLLYGTGAAGSILIHAADSISLSGYSDNQTSGLFSSSLAIGDSGTISIETPRLQILDWASIASSTAGFGQGGAITINGTESILLDGPGGIFSDSLGITGNGGTIDIVTPKLNMNNRSFISTTTIGDGNAGQINLMVGNIALNSSAILTNTLGHGLAGDISIKSSDTFSATRSFIEASNFIADVINGELVILATGEGDAGQICIEAEKSLSVNNQTRIQTSTASSGKAGTVDFSSASISISQESFAGSTSLYENPNLTVQQIGDNGKAGQVKLKADSVLISSSGRVSAETADGKGGSVKIQAEDLKLVGGGSISTSTEGKGSAGDINITDKSGLAADTVVINGYSNLEFELPDGRPVVGQASGIYLNTSGTGRGGSLQLDAGRLAISDGGVISAIAAFGGDQSTQGGDISVTADSVQLSSGGLISAATSGPGKAGNVSVTASEAITVSGAFDRSKHPDITNPRISDLSGINNSATWAIDPNATALGSAGSITMHSPSLNMADAGEISVTTEGQGSGGTIVVRTGELALTSKASIASSSTGTGSAGNLDIQADKVFTNDNGLVVAEAKQSDGGSIRIQTERLAISNGGSVSTSVEGQGKGGNIAVLADEMELLTKGTVASSSTGTGSAGNIDIQVDKRFTNYNGLILAEAEQSDGGSITIQSDKLAISNNGKISTSVEGQGKGGDIAVSGGTLKLLSRGTIASSSVGKGDSGSINIDIDKALLNDSGLITAEAKQSDGGSIHIHSPQLTLRNEGLISASTEGPGTGGAIVVRTHNLALQSGGRISSTSSGTGLAGNIDIDAGLNFRSNNGRITAEAKESDGGNIFLKASDRIHLVDSAITTSVGSGQGKGGNILIDPRFVILDNSQITANAFGGPGGNIHIVADNFIQSPDSLVSASSRFGVDGTVVIDSPDTNLIGKTAALKTPFIDPATLFKQQCAARYAGGQSTLVMNSAGTISPGPGEGLYPAFDESASGETLRLAIFHPRDLAEKNGLSRNCDTQ